MDYISQVEPEFDSKRIYLQLDHQQLNSDNFDEILIYTSDQIVVFEQHVQSLKNQKFNQLFNDQSKKVFRELS